MSSIVQPDPDSNTPTDTDLETAWRLLHSGGLDSLRAEVIAQHLADQRAKYEAVADVLDQFSEDEDFEWTKTGDLQRLGARDAFDVAVTRIRQVTGA